jgi:hypothetical protein
MSECSDETLRHLTTSFWFGIGRDTAAAYAAHEAWLYRRVETIEFIGRHSVKRSISVDFEVPDKLPSLRDRAPKGTSLVPISVLHKWPPPMDFDFVGPTGHSTSRYISTTNKQLDFGLLLGMADRALTLGENMGERTSWGLRRKLARQLHRREPERLAPTLRRELAAVVQSPRPSQTAVAHAVNELRSELNKRLDDALEEERMQDGEELATRIAITVDLAARLAGSSILWVAVQGTPGTDRIVKFSYLDAYGASMRKLPDASSMLDESDGRQRRTAEAWWKRGFIACSWRPRTLFISLPHAGRHVRYHLDIPAPQGGVEPIVVDAMALPAAPGAEDIADAKVRSVEFFARRSPRLALPDEWVGQESSLYFMDYGDPIVLASTSMSLDRDGDDRTGTDRAASAEIADRRTHVSLGARSAPSHRVFLQVKLAATRQGFIRGCVIAALIIAALIVAVYVNLASVADHLEATVVLLSVAPVVLGYVLVRPGEDELERYHISGVRLMALISGATPLIGALTLILTHTAEQGHPPDLNLVRPIWRALMVIGLVMAVGLIVSYFRAAPPKERGDGAAGADSWR